MGVRAEGGGGEVAGSDRVAKCGSGQQGCRLHTASGGLLAGCRLQGGTRQRYRRRQRQQQPAAHPAAGAAGRRWPGRACAAGCCCGSAAAGSARCGCCRAPLWRWPRCGRAARPLQGGAVGAGGGRCWGRLKLGRGERAAHAAAHVPSSQPGLSTRQVPSSKPAGPAAPPTRRAHRHAGPHALVVHPVGHRLHHIGEQGAAAVDELGELVHLGQVAAVQQLLRQRGGKAGGGKGRRGRGVSRAGPGPGGAGVGLGVCSWAGRLLPGRERSPGPGGAAATAPGHARGLSRLACRPSSRPWCSGCRAPQLGPAPLLAGSRAAPAHLHPRRRRVALRQAQLDLQHGMWKSSDLAAVVGEGGGVGVKG
jgi:hypothetical protein